MAKTSTLKAFGRCAFLGPPPGTTPQKAGAQQPFLAFALLPVIFILFL